MADLVGPVPAETEGQIVNLLIPIIALAKPYLALIKAGLVAALVAGLVAIIYHAGAESIQKKWDKAEAVRVSADHTALLKRTEDNAALQATQRETNRLLTKAHDAEIDQVRADLAAAGRLRIGKSICPGPTGQTVTASAGSGDAADPASRVLDPEMDGLVKALILEMEQAAATGRAAQAFIRDNGLAP